MKFHTSTYFGCDKWVLPRARSSRQSLHTRVACRTVNAGGPSYLCSRTCTEYRERKRLRVDSCAEARRVLVLLVGPEIVEHMLRDSTAILCRSCQRDLCKIAQLFKLVESKQSSALSYHSIYRFHRTPPSLPFTKRARAYAVLLYARRYLHHTHLTHLSYITIYNSSTSAVKLYYSSLTRPSLLE